MKRTIVVILAAAFAAVVTTDKPADSGAPPDWYLENIRFMKADGGIWIADNAAYKSDDEPWDSYMMVYQSGPGSFSISGRMFGTRAAKKAIRISGSSANTWSRPERQQ